MQVTGARLVSDAIAKPMPAAMVRASALSHPEGALPIRFNRMNVAAVAVYHAVALLALWPAVFSWSGVALAALGTYVFGTLGINLCYHRLLTHRGLVCPKWLEHGFAILGVCCFQDTPARWVAVHRRHHEHSDEQADPHSPLVSFLWAHMEWVCVVNRDLDRLGIFDRYAKDILRDRFYVALERRSRWLWVVAASWVVFFGAGLLGGVASGRSLPDAAWLGASWLVWGVFVRTVLVWHITWSVNSVAHLWGYRSYATADCSRNNVVVGLISNGEGWHNNHHADPRAARHGHRASEIDVTWYTIRALEAVGLATRVIRPSRQVVDRNGCDSEPA